MIQAIDTWMNGQGGNAAAFDAIAEQFGIWSVLSCLAEQYPDRLADIAAKVKGAKHFHTPLQTPKVIGMYYYRLWGGGIERVIAGLCDIFASLSYKVILFTDEAANDADYPRPLSVKRVVLNADTDRITAWREALEAAPIDLMISHAWISKNLLTDALTIKAMGIPYVQHTHGVFTSVMYERIPELKQYFFILPHIYALFDGVVSLSRVDVAFWHHYCPNSLFTINPSTFSRDSVLPASLDGQTILWMGRLSEQKRPMEAIEIFYLVHQQIPDAKLIMAGADEVGEYGPKLLKRIKELGLESRVTWLGHTKDVKPLYEQACVYLSTASYEGAPVAVVESKAFGLPLAGYALDYLEVMREKKGMVIVPQGDRQGAADAIIALLSDEDHRREMGRQAHLSLRSYDTYASMEQWRKILLSLNEPSAQDANADEALLIDTLLNTWRQTLPSADAPASNGLFHKMRTAASYIKRFGLLRGTKALLKAR